MKALRAKLFTALPLERQRQREWRKEEEEGPRKTLSRILNRMAGRKTEWPRLNATVAHAGWARSQSWMCLFLICTRVSRLVICVYEILIQPAAPQKTCFQTSGFYFLTKKQTNKTNFFFFSFFLDVLWRNRRKLRANERLSSGSLSSAMAFGLDRTIF